MRWSLIDTRLEEASDRAGLAVNDVGRFYLFFKNSGLSSKQIDNIKLQVQGDFRRYTEARSLALRLSPNRSDEAEIFYGDWDYENDDFYYEDGYDIWYGYEDEGWHGDDWQDDPWSNYDWEYEAYYDEESWMWQEQEEQQHDGNPSSSTAAVDSAAQQKDESPGRDHDAGQQQLHEDYYKGKGKSNDGCFICGSRWHLARSCPMSEKGKGKGYGGGYGKGKGYGRPKGKGKYKGKSKGKFRPWTSGKGTWGKGKSKDKGKGSSWYYRKTQGLDATDSIPMDPPQAKEHHYNKTENFVIHSSSSSEELLSAPRSFADGGLTEKKLSFASFLGQQPREEYFSVRGERRRGLIIDPGAASGLIGTETLRDLIEECVKLSNLMDDKVN